MDEMKIRYIKDDDGIIYGAVVESMNGKHSAEYIAPAYGGLWVDGKQTIGHADFYLTGTNSNRRRQLRRAITNGASYDVWDMIEYLQKLRDLIEQHRDKLTDAIADLMWNAYGRPEACITIDEETGDIYEHEMSVRTSWIGEVKIWSSSGYEYANPYEMWELQDWTDAIAYAVGADYLPGVLDQIADEAGAESAADYVRNYEQYDKIDKILQSCAPLQKIYDMIEDDIKSDTESDRRKSADMAIDHVIEDIIKQIEDLERYE